MPKRQIYLLSPRSLSPETIAVAFAKTSRSPETFHEIASQLSEEGAARFHEKWVVGYGHASVAEHAVLHIAFENVSRLAVECIESNRLASYTEKSTRYQKWDPDAFFIPPELERDGRLKTYEAACRRLFETYASSLEPLKQVAQDQNPRKGSESEDAYERRIRSAYVDSCRFLLPAASLANLGMTANARVLENAIAKMLSHPLQEVRQIGSEVRKVALAETPTLVKYANELPYLIETARDFHSLELETSGQVGSEEDREWCRLVDHDPDGEVKILASALYRFGDMTYEESTRALRQADLDDLKHLAGLLLNRLGEHDVPLRELEHTSYTFDLVLDQGGYAELKRHRMMTQTPQLLTTRLGYACPRMFIEAGLEASYHAAMEAAAEAYEILSGLDPQLAAYVVPNGFHRRVLLTMNLREAFAFCRLRTAANAHFSLRRIAQRIAAEIKAVHPVLGEFMHLPTETWQEIEKNWFSP